MAVSLAKGQKVSLSKAPGTGPAGLTKIRVGLGWQKRVTVGDDFDLDASAFQLNANGKCRQDKDFVFYGNDKSPEQSITYGGDNRTGDGDGDDEFLVIDLTKMAADVKEVDITVTIDKWQERRQSFGQVTGAYIRVIDEATGTEIYRYDLSEDYSTETALVFGKVYNNNGEWKFQAVGTGFPGGLAEICRGYGIDAA